MSRASSAVVPERPTAGLDDAAFRGLVAAEPRAGVPATYAPSVVPGLLMLIAGLVFTARPVLSWDEIATADVAGRTAGQIWRLAHHVDGVFAPYYLFMHAWTGLAGNSVLMLRLPSIVAMAVAVALTGELGRRLISPFAGLVAGVLMVLLPCTSRYAAEARPYAIAMLFSVLALLLLFRALVRPGSGRWIGYGLAVAALGFSHIVALSVLAAHLAIVVRHRAAPSARRSTPGVRSGRRSFRGPGAPLAPGGSSAAVSPGAPSALFPPGGSSAAVPAEAPGVAITPGRQSNGGWGWVSAVGGALVLVAPLVWFGAHQRDAQLSWVPPLSTGALRSFPRDLIGSAEAGWLLIGLVVATAMSSAASAGRRPQAATSVGRRPQAATSVGRRVAAFFGLRAGAAADRPVPDLLAAALLPLAVVAAVSLVGPSFWVSRYLLIVVPPVVVLAAVAVTGAFSRTLLVVLLGLTCAVWPAQRALRGTTAKNGSDYRAAAAIIARNERPGDGIVYEPRSRTLRAGIDYYAAGDAGRPRDVLLRQSAADVGALRATENSAAGVAGLGRFWLLVTGTYADPAVLRPELRPLIAGSYRRTAVWHVKRGTLALYERR